MWKCKAIINSLFVYNNYIVYIYSMKANKVDMKCGIYCIRNTVNGKIYIGKSKNIYKRIHQHLYDLKNNRKDCENNHLLRSWYKYGNENFEYFVLEYLKVNDNLCRERELFWMNKLKSLDKRFGYNLRQDSSTNMIVHKDTSKKISKRLKKEWKSGVRDNHGKKLAKNWKDNPKRAVEQSLLFSKLKTRYYYYLYDLNNKKLEKCNYERLKELKLSNVQTDFYKKKTNSVKFKGYIIQRVKLKI